ncbi:aminoacyl-tRNA hydrolase [Heliobacterium gestii]|uniref:Peptidyl-tRNA hydrolase n=1 Tax=Heliomicrobium gestii TaxID=2699 RepID=A0A845L873_HELGE|nr:aminoacyl-tRNA hydrolase [Heliomicrobium gestii]MBM7866393.1 PTH1 family peptidyl-tRNA hydrolase [Heliomicrobium gestii]MZP42822.1 aminoacyl-tRNA hydrolase [Heliomicrobium gestii]
MKAIVGLGNPGLQYARTRHNIGFMVIDRLAEMWGADGFRDKFQGLCSEARVDGEKVLLLKPQTYMNLSGQAVAAMAVFYKLPPEDILVIYDDMDLNLGKLRARAKGSSGGHNGMKSIIALLGTEEFPRLKMGIGRPAGRRPAAAHVLESFTDEERETVKAMIDQGGDAAALWLRRDIIEVMNRFNAGEKPAKGGGKSRDTSPAE